MFSMKYTSPKVTPKKGVVPSGGSAAALDLDASRGSASSADAAAEVHGGDGMSAGPDLRHPANGFARRDAPHRHARHYSGVRTKQQHNVAADADENDTAEQTSPSPLTKDNIPPNIRNDSSMSENDSAVANVAEDVEPRSNLLALLDRELHHGHSGSGSGESDTSSGRNAMPKQRSDGDDKEATGSDRDIVTKDPVDDGEVESRDQIDAGKSDASENTNTEQPPLSPRDLPRANTFEDSLAYRRTASMEPLFDVSPEVPSVPAIMPMLRTTSPDEESVEVEPLKSDSILSSSGSEEDEDAEVEHHHGEEVANDAQTKSPMHGAETGTDVSSSLVYDVSETHPASPVMSDLNGESLRNGERHYMTMESPAHSGATTTSEIGGDTYFDEPAPARLMPRRSDSIEDDLVHVTLPPRVNRTMSLHPRDSSPFLSAPSTPSQMADLGMSPFPKQGPAQPMSPRPNFSHTHSLLDDCSDEETTSFDIVDSPTRHVQSYSCLPRPRSGSEGSSPFASYFNKRQRQQVVRRRNDGSGGHSFGTNGTANRVASDNIQRALLETRHRRWECMMAHAGPHAQPKEVLDVSNRVHYIAGYLPANGQGSVLAARLSVSVEAIRAAALASGLWRTVRLVRLPRGLFWNREDDGEVWALLRMLDATFPALRQIDFGGDVSRATNGNDGLDDIVGADDGWRDDVLACIMECVPNLVAIDGYVVEREPSGTIDKVSKEEVKSPLHEPIPLSRSPHHSRGKSDGAVDHAAACGDFGEDCQMDSMCGLSDLVDDQVDNGQLNTSTGATVGVRGLDDSILSNVTEETGRMHTEQQPDVEENASENISSIVDKCDSADSEPELARLFPANESAEDRSKQVHNLPSPSMLSSSRSWGSNGSGSRPPPCPTSASRQRSARLPTKPADRKKSRSLFKAGTSGLKRRVLGLIPAVSMMDDEEDEDDDDSEESESGVETECPTDLL